MSHTTVLIIALTVKAVAGIGAAICSWLTYRSKRRRGRRKDEN